MKQFDAISHDSVKGRTRALQCLITLTYQPSDDTEKLKKYIPSGPVRAVIGRPTKLLFQTRTNLMADLANMHTHTSAHTHQHVSENVYTRNFTIK